MLWRQQILVDAAFDLLAVLAALNRIYFSRFELKRLRALVAAELPGLELELRKPLGERERPWPEP